MSALRLTRLSFALLILTAIACGDDDPVVPGDSAFQTSVALRGDAFSYQPYYDSELVYTSHTLIWAVDGSTVKDFGPGKQVKITCRFDPPIVARRGDISAYVTLETDPRGFCTTDHINVDGDFGVDGDWPLTDSQCRVMRECSESFPVVRAQWAFTPIAAGSELSIVTVTFVVPATYQSGQPIASDALPVATVRVSSTDNGADTLGDPPVWPVGVPLSEPAAR